MKTARRLAPSHYKLLAALRYGLLEFLEFSRQAAVRAGLTPQQHQALLAIKGFPGREEVTVGELAERLNSRHHSVVGLVDRLMSRELVRRRHDEEDRRRVLLRLTPKAEELLLALSLAHRDELRRLAPLLQQLLQAVTA